jgi:hypothetical protein
MTTKSTKVKDDSKTLKYDPKLTRRLLKAIVEYCSASCLADANGNPFAYDYKDIQRLLEAKADPETLGHQQPTPLLFVLDSGNPDGASLELCKLLISYGANPRSKTSTLGSMARGADTLLDYCRARQANPRNDAAGKRCWQVLADFFAEFDKLASAPVAPLAPNPLAVTS